MQLSGGRHFSYCLNVHPGEGLDDILQVLRTDVPEIKKSLSPHRPFGLGLRIAREASLTLRSPEALEKLKEEIRGAGCYAFTVNGFPFGAFHRTRVKEQVYLPDWSSPERPEYTLDLFRQLGELLPEDYEGSVSTVPLGYKFDPEAPGKIGLMADRLAALALELRRLEDETGRRLHLGLEPEPDCMLETTAEAVAFFKENLFRNRKIPEEILRRHLGICLDTCHAAMQFEDPAESVRMLGREGLRISKTQISAALECDPEIDPGKLRDFDDGVYLHQVRSSTGKSWRDLPDFLATPDSRAGRLRIHAHVPLHWAGCPELQSTRHTLGPEFWSALAASDCRHIEVETYTFNVLPEEIRRGNSIARDMIAESRWVLPKLESGSVSGH